jgi:acetyl-CoA carboxylase biotin carboxylase subunit
VTSPIRRLLVANRGEIALRVIRTARERGIETVAVYSDADRGAMHARAADRAVHIGPPAPAESYLRIDRIIDAARRSGADAIHPGYGFLSENARFAEACAAAGIRFVGPPADAIRAMGDKVRARQVAARAGVPLVPGMQEEALDPALLAARARQIGFPVMLKAAAGGGGRGIRIVRDAGGLAPALRLAQAEARAAFGDDRVYLEKLLARPRHVEIQVMADAHGKVVAWGERECSVQRRHQKLVEESPCPVLAPELRGRMQDAACALAREVGYAGAGTVEFLWSEGAFHFLEMNTRLQVEHPITEQRFGVDLVAEQLHVAAGGVASDASEPRGHAIEIRLNAEDPVTFLPASGRVTSLRLPAGPGIRFDGCVEPGFEILPHYDSMLGKLIVHATDRDAAIARAIRALQELRIGGIKTSAPAALRVLQSPEFRSGDYDTGILERIDRAPPAAAIEVAALAAALWQHSRTERTGSGAGTPQPAASPWTLIDRLERLQGRAP